MAENLLNCTMSKIISGVKIWIWLQWAKELMGLSLQ